jgi:hypothetical protein
MFDQWLLEWTIKLRYHNMGDGIPADTHPPIAVDVLVPTYRCDPELLRGIQAACREVGAMLIVQVDNPTSKNLPAVLELEDTHTRIRVNPRNLGAPATRNRLLAESRADAIVFWDDDVRPLPGALASYVTALTQAGSEGVCGAVGAVRFPPSADAWHEATRMSDILYAFDWPVGVFTEGAAPWGMTANICMWRRHVPRDGFGIAYAKGGGGENVDFCLRASLRGALRFLHVRLAAVEHPFWSRPRGVRGWVPYLRHFWDWTQRDGLPLDRFPEHVYHNLPNVVEATPFVWVALGTRGVCVLWAIEILIEARRDSWRSSHARHLPLSTRLAAAVLSGVVKNVVDVGHTFYWLRRGRIGMICCRFDWFSGLTSDVVNGERAKFAERWAVWILCWVVLAALL